MAWPDEVQYAKDPLSTAFIPLRKALSNTQLGLANTKILFLSAIWASNNGLNGTLANGRSLGVANRLANKFSSIGMVGNFSSYDCCQNKPTTGLGAVSVGDPRITYVGTGWAKVDNNRVLSFKGRQTTSTVNDELQVNVGAFIFDTVKYYYKIRAGALGDNTSTIKADASPTVLATIDPSVAANPGKSIGDIVSGTFTLARATHVMKQTNTAGTMVELSFEFFDSTIKTVDIYQFEYLIADANGLMWYNQFSATAGPSTPSPIAQLAPHLVIIAATDGMVWNPLNAETANLETRLTALINSCKAAGASVLVINSPPFNDANNPTMTPALQLSVNNRVLATAAVNNVPAIDLYSQYEQSFTTMNARGFYQATDAVQWGRTLSTFANQDAANAIFSLIKAVG